jgi:hypothetical protein
MKENKLKIQLLFFIVFVSPFTWGSSSFQGTLDDDEKVKHLLEIFKNNTLELLGTAKNSNETPIESTIKIKFEKFSVKNSIKITPSRNENEQEKQVSSFSSAILTQPSVLEETIPIQSEVTLLQFKSEDKNEDNMEKASAKERERQIKIQAANAALFEALNGLSCPKILRDIKNALKNEADVNAKDSKGRTPLILAAINKNPAAVEILLKAILEAKKGGIDQLDNEGKSPLAYAVDRVNIENVKFLVGAGANVNITYPKDKNDKNGKPLIVHLAEKYKNTKGNVQKQALVAIAKELGKSKIIDGDLSLAVNLLGLLLT